MVIFFNILLIFLNEFLNVIGLMHFWNYLGSYSKFLCHMPCIEFLALHILSNLLVSLLETMFSDEGNMHAFQA